MHPSEPEPDLSRATPLQRAGYQYWRSKCAGKPMPARADIRPEEIKALLPHVVLLDVRHDPLDFRYRLIGTAVATKLFRDYTGECLSTIEHQRAPSRIWTIFETVVATQRPSLNDMPYVGPHKDFLAVCDMVAPLSADGRTVDMLFIVVDFVRRPPAAQA